MTESQLMYAAMLALTKQNMAFKLAPLSTAQMQGQVINRNIAIGETVVCWMNNSGELTRVGDVPTHYGDFFIDDNNHMYYKKGQNEDLLVECDALTGEIFSESETCLRFVLSGDNQVAAYCTEEGYDPNYSKWVVIFKDGTRTSEIVRDRALYTSSSHYAPIIYRFGYRNSVLAVCNYTSGERGFAVSTYTQNGILIKNLWTGSGYDPQGQLVCPINDSLVCIAHTTGSVFGYQFFAVDYYTPTQVSSYNPFPDDEHPGSAAGSVIGCDQVYCYMAFRVYENGEWIDQYKIARIPIDSYDVEIVKDIEGQLAYYGYASVYGHIIQQVDVDRTMIDVGTMGDVYTEVLQNLPNSPIQENVGWIWIPGSGIYQKTPLGWLMSATGEYPRSSPWGKCGYAIGNYKIGQNGLAIVLFE